MVRKLCRHLLGKVREHIGPLQRSGDPCYHPVSGDRVDGEVEVVNALAVRDGAQAQDDDLQRARVTHNEHAPRDRIARLFLDAKADEAVVRGLDGQQYEAACTASEAQLVGQRYGGAPCSNERGELFGLGAVEGIKPSLQRQPGGRARNANSRGCRVRVAHVSAPILHQ